jgi:Cu+-exporting ATPase
MTAPVTDRAEARVELTVSGMTCATCALRIEKKLNKIDGVKASVNYATEKAAINYDPALVGPAEMLAAIEAIGYSAASASVPESGTGSATPAPNDGAHHLASIRQRLLISAVLSAPVVVISMVDPWHFRNWQWLMLALAGPVAVWGAWPFHRAAALNARHGLATMDTLISVGVSAAFLWSLWALFFGDAGRTAAVAMAGMSHSSASGHIYLEVASAVTVFILAGRYAETKAKHRAGDALRALADLGAKSVNVIDSVESTSERTISTHALLPGMLFVVRPGEKIATDGVVVAGRSAVDQALITGESVPIDVGPNDPVIGATVNTSGRLVVRATRVGADTALAGIARLVEQAQSGKAAVQRLADRVAAVFVPAVILLAIGTLTLWLATGHPADRSFTAAVAVLIIACPCALGLATPTALLV